MSGAQVLPPLSTERAQRLVSDFAKTRVLVIGDVMLDRFLIGVVSRISPEAPVPIVKFDHEMHRIGGAANVAHNIASLGATAHVVGVTGRDDSAALLADACRVAGIDASLVADSGRPTTTKVRIVTDRNQQVARVDYESEDEIPAAVEDALIERIRAGAAEAAIVVVSDYLKGAVTRRVMDEVRSAGRSRGIPVLVDPKIPHLAYYAGADVITPNHYEAEAATHRRVRGHDEARATAVAFRDLAKCGAVLMTRGDQGMWLLDARVEGYLPAAAREVADVTGAGDTVIATLALVLACGGAAAEGARLANQAAGIVVGKFGPSVITPTELIQACQAAAAI